MPEQFARLDVFPVQSFETDERVRDVRAPARSSSSRPDLPAPRTPSPTTTGSDRLCPPGRDSSSSTSLPVIERTPDNRCASMGIVPFGRAAPVPAAAGTAKQR
ncbi:hypothetical protein GCM10022222_44880 [Amycolatopsis ultiminotia]|uniref:Uncharacterized protein n=1 Tax=Amycolatopsis ultiminotia TaxID=543629 RepID=A0ABP6WYY7_9PSEU